MAVPFPLGGSQSHGTTPTSTVGSRSWPRSPAATGITQSFGWSKPQARPRSPVTGDDAPSLAVRRYRAACDAQGHHTRRLRSQDVERMGLHRAEVDRCVGQGLLPSATRRLFLNQYIGLAASPIGPAPALPSETQLDAITAGKQYDPKRLIVQEDGLGGGVTVNTPPYNIVQANCGSTLTGYQTKVPGRSPTSPTRSSRRSARASTSSRCTRRMCCRIRSVLAPYTASLPASSVCMPLTLTASSASNGASTLTATTDVHLSGGETINIFQQTRVGGYVTTKCTASAQTSACALPPGAQTVTFEADIGAPGTLPHTPRRRSSRLPRRRRRRRPHHLDGRGPPCAPDCF